MGLITTALAITGLSNLVLADQGLHTEPAHVSLAQVGATPSHVYYVHLAVPFDLKTIDNDIVKVQSIIQKRHEVNGEHDTRPLNNEKFHYKILPNHNIPADAMTGHIQHLRLGALRQRVKFLHTLLTPTDKLAGKKYAQDPFRHTEFHGPKHARLHKRSADDPEAATRRLSVNQIHQAMSEAVTPHDSNTSKAIQKRELITAIIVGIGAGIASFAIAATISSSFQQEELSAISHATNDLNHAERLQLDALLQVGSVQRDMTKLINGLIVANDGYYASISLNNRIHVVVDELERRLNDAEAVLQDAGRSKVNINLLKQFDLQGSALHVAKEAEKRGLVPLAMHASDWLALQASFVETDNGFDALLHVPIVKAGSLLAIYKNARIPVPTGDNLHMVIGGDRLQYIAVSPDRKAFKAFTEDAWQQCQQLGTFQLCDFGHTLRIAPQQPPRHKDEGLCVYYLLTRNFKAAGLTCEIFIGQETETIQRTGPREFLSYTHSPVEAQMDCEGNSNAFNHHLAFTLTGSQKITLPPNCRVRTPTHTFASADAGFMDRSHLTVTYAWPLPLEELTQGLDTSQFKSLLEDGHRLLHRTNSTRMIPLSHAVRALNDVSTTTNHTWMASGILAGIVAIIAASVTCYCCRKKNQGRHQATSTDTPLVQFNAVQPNEARPPTAPAAALLPPPVTLPATAAADLAALVAVAPAAAAEFVPQQAAQGQLRGFSFPTVPPAPGSLPPQYAK